jgi:hypothetical protein
MYLSRCSSKPSRMERAGYQDLEDIEPITVAAYIEILQRRATRKYRPVVSTERERSALGP